MEIQSSKLSNFGGLMQNLLDLKFMQSQCWEMTANWNLHRYISMFSQINKHNKVYWVCTSIH